MGKFAKPEYAMLMLVAGIINIGGRWRSGKGVSIDMVIGLFGVTVGLSLMAEVDTGLANGFAGLVIMASLLEYGPDLLSGGQTGTSPAPDPASKAKK